MPRRPETERADDQEAQRYRAPALDKGIDVLELVSRAPTPLTLSAITKELGRSTGELFRMILVLERRGYIRQVDGGGYAPTSRLFQLAMEQAPIKTLQEFALPWMRTLSARTEQSCHLAVRAGGDIVIISRMESSGLLGYSVRLGYRRPIPLAASGMVLYAFQPYDVRENWESEFQPALSDNQLVRLRRDADKILRQGSFQQNSTVMPGVTDISAPIMRGDLATAALTMPFVRKAPLPVDLDGCLAILKEIARAISAELAATDYRI
ncbi:IclR family transcriptional regulator [Sphingomonas sp. Leaf231]|uniref:IclR family transcriptional regulator n=1 Tax=Sphingomonas sp. Leaf231 TaxID=1736301 RepID=UPI0006FF11C9|nr:IclR family transcriptional regulator [Sphingomonas sp. Leaf231]KQN90968.1 IclR family transcriptional regulator [Sphingomonas sp. Leaf231]